MQKPWNKHHRIIYLLLGCAGTKATPSERGVDAVGRYVGELMDLGVLPTDDDVFQAIWSDVWLQQHADRQGGFPKLLERAIHHANVLRGEVDRVTAQSLVVLGLMGIAKAEGPPSPEQMGYIMGCGKMLGV
jgi:hypothetical protein